MKLPKLLYYCSLLFCIVTFTQCKKNKNEEPQLPPETTTGAMTFGCKIDGKIFVPKDGRGRPGLYVQYINLGNVPDGGWHLNIPAVDQESQSNETIQIITDSLLLEEGNTYSFRREIGFSNIRYSYGVDLFVNEYNIGQLIIIKHDKNEKILSGKFWFDAIDLTGKKVEVRDGRFDIRY